MRITKRRVPALVVLPVAAALTLGGAWAANAASTPSATPQDTVATTSGNGDTTRARDRDCPCDQDQHQARERVRDRDRDCAAYAQRQGDGLRHQHRYMHHGPEQE